MKTIKYNPDTEPLAHIVDEIQLGNEVETPVFTVAEGEYIRQRLTAIFNSIAEEWFLVTGIKWPKPVPHLIKKKWRIDNFTGTWKIKVDWRRKTRKQIVLFTQIKKEEEK